MQRCFCPVSAMSCPSCTTYIGPLRKALLSNTYRTNLVTGARQRLQIRILTARPLTMFPHCSVLSLQLLAQRKSGTSNVRIATIVPALAELLLNCSLLYPPQFGCVSALAVRLSNFNVNAHYLKMSSLACLPTLASISRHICC